jgi:hypothetical protein
MSKNIFELNLNEPVKLTQNLDNFMKEVSNIKNVIVNRDILYTPGKFSKKAAEIVPQISSKKKAFVFFEHFLENKIKHVIDKKTSSIVSSFDDCTENHSNWKTNLSLQHVTSSNKKFKSNPQLLFLNHLNFPKTTLMYKNNTISNQAHTTERKTFSDFYSFKQSKINLLKKFTITKADASTKLNTANTTSLKLSIFENEIEKCKNITTTAPYTQHSPEKYSKRMNYKHKSFNIDDKESVNKFIAYLPKLIKRSECINKELMDCSNRYNRKNNYKCK